jgi:hypothetical protein
MRKDELGYQKKRCQELPNAWLHFKFGNQSIDSQNCDHTRNYKDFPDEDT